MIWSKSASSAPDDWVLRFTVGDDWRWDRLLLPYDLRGTEAHAWALAQIGLLTENEHARIAEALEAIAKDAESGAVTVDPEDEDCHTVIERELTERLGDLGKKIHAGRSRNDQVLVALRLWMRDGLDAVIARIEQTADALIRLAEANGDAVMPAYTHLQRAMPTTAALWAAAYAELLLDDLDGLRFARAQANTSPWGSAAGYGVPHLHFDRDGVAERLGFERVQRHVPAVQLSRGKLEAAVVHALVQVGLTANRLASDLVLFATGEFAFVKLPAAHTTGSSIMPQKRNPDVLELARATYHRLTSELHLLLTLPANLPGGYHRDLQLTKEAAMRSLMLSADLFSALAAGLPALQFDRERMRAALTPDLFATDEALRRTAAGTPFRDAYREVAAELGSIAVPDDPLAPYATPGTPGHADTDGLRERLARGGD
jgi:argininosuccinate lyase